MNASPFTLLIVESTPIADFIRELDLPWLEVVATEGYCWQPRFDPKSNKLKARAHPDKAHIRKKIKEKAAWAVRIVIATDPDPSGDFIAWALARFLDKKKILRTSIHDLGPSSIKERLDAAWLQNAESLHFALQNLYIIRYQWAVYFKGLQMSDAGLAALFYSEQPFYSFTDASENRFHSESAVMAVTGDIIKLKPTLNQPPLRFTTPLSTADILEHLVSQKGWSYSKSQDLLNTLFMTPPKGFPCGLITYPRADVRALYHSTWKATELQWVRQGDIEKLKPVVCREILDDTAPHESIHPVHLADKPDLQKGLLTSDLQFVYTSVYNLHMDAITSHSVPFSVYTPADDEKNLIFPVNEPMASGVKKIMASWTPADIGVRLAELNVIKASTFGSAMDRWLRDDWLIIQNGFVYPGPNLTDLKSRALGFRGALKTLSRLMPLENLTPATLHSLFSSIPNK